MISLSIVVADATRARLYTFEQMESADGGHAQEMHERISLVHPARRRRPSELFTDSRPGADRAPNGRGFAHDDHREAALRHMDRQFATDIVDELERLVRTHGHREVILSASPRMLGMMRELTGRLEHAGVTFHQIDRDLVRLTRSQLQDHLSGRGLLPQRERLGA